MRLLCFSPIIPSSVVSGEQGYNGGGWIDSFLVLFSSVKEVEIHVCFLTNKSMAPICMNGIYYHPIHSAISRKSKFGKMKANLKFQNIYKEDLLLMENIANSVRPDIVHFFGTEWEAICVLSRLQFRSVAHIQGLAAAYDYVFTPPGISLSTFRWKAIKNLWKLFRGRTYYTQKKRFTRLAETEREMLPKVKHIFGRTEWDKNITTFLAPDATYYTINELLRGSFYESSKWRLNSTDSEVLHLCSTLSDSPYKGLDVVYKTAEVLSKYKKYKKICWHLCGVTETSAIAKLFISLKTKSDALEFIFEGVVDEKKLVTILLNSHVYVHCGYIDNSSNSICEAQYLGVPIVAVNVGGTSSLITHLQSGVLVAANDPFNMSACIWKLATDNEFAESISKEGIKVAEKRHNPDEILQSLLLSYSKILFSTN